MKKYAAVFPGQGSQSMGMLSALATAHPQVVDTFSQASEVLGYDLWELVQQGPAEKLNIATYTQPAMFVSGVAVYRVFRAAGAPDPVAVAGHSLGEYTALVAAGVFDFVDAVEIIATRCQLMNDAVPQGQGGMAAVLGMQDDDIVALCKQHSGERIVEAVNFNSPAQVVISGHLDAIERVMQAATEAGARRCVLLPVNVPNHSSLMHSVVQPLAEKIDSVEAHEPLLPVVQNNEATLCQSRGEILNSLRKHVANPVYWAQTINHMQSQGAQAVIELGPGKVLTGLSKRIDRRLPSAAVEDPDSLQKALALLAEE